VQRNLQEEPLEVPELVEEERMMTFRQFIGIHEMPVIVEGRTKMNWHLWRAKAIKRRPDIRCYLSTRVDYQSGRRISRES
jgi:hypothetical protein